MPASMPANMSPVQLHLTRPVGRFLLPRYRRQHQAVLIEIIVDPLSSSDIGCTGSAALPLCESEGHAVKRGLARQSFLHCGHRWKDARAKQITLSVRKDLRGVCRASCADLRVINCTCRANNRFVCPYQAKVMSKELHSSQYRVGRCVKDSSCSASPRAIFARCFEEKADALRLECGPVFMYKLPQSVRAFA